MAARSFAITLRNITNLTLRRTDMQLAHGIWSNNGDDVPPETINPMTKVWWQSESNGFATGTEGNVTYKTDQGQVYIHWDDPFVGGNGLGVDVPPSITEQHGDISGDNASVTITLTPNI